VKAFSGEINEDYGWEIALFHKLRNFSDGITFFEMKINWDRYLADHSPRFCIHIVIMNHTLLEMNIYYLHHRDMQDD